MPSECAALITADKTAELLPPLPPLRSKEEGILPLPADYVSGPSHAVGASAPLVGSGAPYIAIYPVVDTAMFDPARYHRKHWPHASDSAESAAQLKLANDPATMPQASPHLPKVAPEFARHGVDVVIGTAGRLAPEKNPGMLVQSFAIAWSALMRVGIKSRLLIAGKADTHEYADGLLGLVKALGLPPDAVRSLRFDVQPLLVMVMITAVADVLLLAMTMARI